MKSLILLIATLAVITLTTSAPSTVNATSSQKHRATMKFDQPVKLMNVMLQGEYLFVHDDAAMARGEACSSVYKGNAEVANKLVVSFHCSPADRVKATHFTVQTQLNTSRVYEITEYQFAGSKEGHVVPIDQPAEHLNNTSVD